MNTIMPLLRRLVLIILLLPSMCTVYAEERISVHFEVRWHRERNPMDTLRRELDVPYLHVVYQNHTDTAYYLVRQDQSNWIFPRLRYYTVIEAIPRTEELSLTHYVPRWATFMLHVRGAELQKRKVLTRQVLLQDQAWEVELEPSILDGKPKPRITYEEGVSNWSERAYYLQGYLYYLMNPQQAHDWYQVTYLQGHAMHSVATEAVVTKGELRPYVHRLAFLPARSRREYVYSLLAFRLIRGRWHFMLPDWQASVRLRDEGTSLNVYLLRDQEAPTSPQGYALPDRYEGYQLYQGLVRGDSIWIEM